MVNWWLDKDKGRKSRTFLKEAEYQKRLFWRREAIKEANMMGGTAELWNVLIIKGRKQDASKI